MVMIPLPLLFFQGPLKQQLIGIRTKLDSQNSLVRTLNSSFWIRYIIFSSISKMTIIVRLSHEFVDKF